MEREPEREERSSVRKQLAAIQQTRTEADGNCDTTAAQIDKLSSVLLVIMSKVTQWKSMAIEPAELTEKVSAKESGLKFIRGKNREEFSQVAIQFHKLNV